MMTDRTSSAGGAGPLRYRGTASVAANVTAQPAAVIPQPYRYATNPRVTNSMSTETMPARVDDPAPSTSRTACATNTCLGHHRTATMANTISTGTIDWPGGRITTTKAATVRTRAATITSTRHLLTSMTIRRGAGRSTSSIWPPGLDPQADAPPTLRRRSGPSIEVRAASLPVASHTCWRTSWSTFACLRL